MDSFTFGGCMVSLDINKAVSELIVGVSSVARWCEDLIALETNVGSGHGITGCSVKLDFELMNSSHSDHACGETQGLYLGRSRRRCSRSSLSVDRDTILGMSVGSGQPCKHTHTHTHTHTALTHTQHSHTLSNHSLSTHTLSNHSKHSFSL